MASSIGPRGPTRTWRVLGLELAIGDPDERMVELALRAIGAERGDLRGFRVASRSLDARRRPPERRLKYLVHADVTVDASFRNARLSRAVESGRVVEAASRVAAKVERVHDSLRGAHVAVLGAGPAGLFAALVLGRHGVRTTLVERGSAVEERSRELVAFHRSRKPNPESNLLFGEGGAGTYSDGKLYTRVDDPLELALLEELVECGAPAAIVWDARAHIGTDVLHRVIPRFRARLVEAGVEIAFGTRVDDLVAANGVVRAIATTRGEVRADALVLATGHSARDTWARLHERGVPFEAKPFQLGVRIEHPQELVDRAQHGVDDDAAALGAASYALVARAEDGFAACHSFCMCPGGRIVASVNEAGYLCTNGMSNSRHSSPYANAALVATIGPREYGPGAFAGVEFQRAVEARFFEAGGGDYTAPAQRADDFLAGRESRGELRSSYVLGARAARVDEMLPAVVRDALRHGLARFERRIPGFSSASGLLVGVESRSSGPVRIPRDATTRRAVGFTNLYPVGEGAGWAGGITSAALDGARAALSLLERGLA